MNRIAVLLTLLLALAPKFLKSSFLVQDANSDILQIINGIFEYTHLPDPTTINGCLFTSTSAALIDLIKRSVQQCSTGSLSAITTIEKEINDFITALPPEILSCLNTNEEVINGMNAYCLANVDPEIIQKRLETYFIVHLSAVVKSCINIESTLNARQLNSVGQQIGAFVKTALDCPTMIFFNKGPNKEVLEVIDGFLKGIGLQDPKLILSCFDEITSAKLISFIETILNEVCYGSISALTQIEKDVQTFIESFPISVSECLNGNQEILQSKIDYCIADTDPFIIRRKIEDYFIFHLSSVMSPCNSIQSASINGEYDNAGQQIGALTLKILGCN